MRIMFTCAECMIEGGEFHVRNIRVPDDGLLDGICPKGHRSFNIVQQMKFEILSQMAIRAIVDGYYRDSVASFMGALERLHEFFTETICRRSGVEHEAFVEAWKPLRRSSERQLGAFTTTFLIETGHPPKLLSEDATAFRNRVIHNGRLPDRDEVVRFGREVAECALPLLKMLKAEPYCQTVQTLVLEKMRERSERARAAGVRVATSSFDTFFSLSRLDDRTVEAAAASEQAWKEIVGADASSALS